MRAPGRRDALHRGGVGDLPQRIGALDRVADAEVPDGQHVGALQVEHQEHVCAPDADALDGNQLGDHLLVGQLVQALQLEFPGEGVLGQRAQVADLRAREARGGAQLFGLIREDLLGRRGAPLEALGQAQEDAAGGLRRELLADDRADQGAVVVGGAPLAGVAEFGADRVDHSREHRVRAAQVGESSRQRAAR